MLNNLKLGTKLNILLLSIFLFVMIISGTLLARILQTNAEKSVTEKAQILIEAMGAVREYTTNEIDPELSPKLETEEQFLAQTVPAYSAREVFENFRKRPEYKDFFYKEAAENPTNLRDKADDFEREIIEQFRRQPDLKESSGFQSLPGEKLFYIARPLIVTEESCLRCHSTPEVAPKSQLLTYGDKNGFNWQLNAIVGARIISVPAAKVFKRARELQFLGIGILAFFLLLIIVLINLFLRIVVTSPIVKMSQEARKVSTGDMSIEFQHHSQDEIGVLAASLNRMKVSLQIAMDMIISDPDSREF